MRKVFRFTNLLESHTQDIPYTTDGHNHVKADYEDQTYRAYLSRPLENGPEVEPVVGVTEDENMILFTPDEITAFFAFVKQFYPALFEDA